MTSSAPGVFGGDTFEQTIVVEQGARVRLTSQSATQVHPGAGGAEARLTSTYRVEAGGHLRCEWDPVIPFRQANVEQDIYLDLAEGATLFWSDALMAGREARGERWAFARLAHQLRLTRGARLEYLERYAIVPADCAVDLPWRGADACYFGSTLSVGPGCSRELAESLQAQLGNIDGVRGAADLVERDVLLVRLMGRAGVPFHEARARTTGLIA
jgi:urease accessory protein